MPDANEKIQYYENILLNKYDFRVIKRLQKLYRDNGYYQKGIDLCKKLLKADPNNAGFLSDLGRLYLLTGQMELAENSFVKALQLDSNNTFAYQNLAAFYLREKNFEKAKPLCIYLMQKNKMLEFELADLFKLAKCNLDTEIFEYINAYISERMIFENRKLLKYKFDSLIQLNKLEEAEKLIDAYQIDDNSRLHYATKLIWKKAKNIYETNQAHVAIDFIRGEIIQNPEVFNIIKRLPALCKSDSEIQYAINMINEFCDLKYEQCIRISTIANLHNSLGDYESEKKVIETMDYYCKKKYLSRKLKGAVEEKGLILT